ncbi:MAG: peptide chain release factor 1, partial [Chlamydiae bacterium]|nr:peptide chain release factor 1 [Chlamydiota bacterium]
LLLRFGEVEELLGRAEVIADKKQYKALTTEHAYLYEIQELWREHEKAKQAIVENQALLKEEMGPELLEMIKEDLRHQKQLVETLEKKLHTILVPPDPRDSRNIIMELRAGTGGDEAALFVGDCVRMYKLYADKQGWSHELLSFTPSEMGGFKEYVFVLSGKNVFRFMQYEAGTHRVQRVPATEAQGRVHTSTITVAVLLEPDEEEEIKIDEKDLRIDTYRASGAGGQHINTTDSAVRITHLPTGTVVYCQQERSQHKNKDKAMRLLSAKLVEEKRRQQQEEVASLRSSQVGTGDRSERIRTYNFSQNRVTDHRIDLTLYKLDQVMNGDLGDITEALVSFFYELK